MRRLATLLSALALTVLVASVASATTGTVKPPAGTYTAGGKNGFKINKARTSVSGFRISLTVDADGTNADADCTTTKLPAGKLSVTITKPMKLVAAHRGGSTTYIVGRSTPSTSNGITPIAETFHLGGTTAKGTIYLAWTSPNAVGGDGEVSIEGCDLLVGFHKQR